MNVTALFSQAVWAEGFAPGAAARICSIARALGGIARRFCSTCFQSRSNAALFTAMDGGDAGIAGANSGVAGGTCSRGVESCSASGNSCGSERLVASMQHPRAMDAAFTCDGPTPTAVDAAFFCNGPASADFAATFPG
jgi:hypothetical protein